jgi:alkanesulfonate monooxygenase SsuD/methylene tetrahydromethanopterin reductase-like flavin-dependent oxidoreductase (luciferase family)
MTKSWIFEIFNYPYDPRPEAFDPKACQEVYDWHLESWVRAEELGFDGVLFSEHHFTAYNLSPSPNLLVAALAQRTKSIRLGVMANITAFHNPRRLAEETAMLDYLTHGRLEVGLGRGVDEQEFLKEGVPMEETRARFEEALELMHAAWSNPVFSHHGRFWNYREVSIYPRPLQPRPPIWITALSPQTVEWAARKGYRSACAFLPPAQMKEYFDLYRAAADEENNPTGPDQFAVLRNVFVADSDAEARDIAEPALDRLFALFKDAAVFHDLDHVPEGYEFYSSFFRPFAASDGPVTFKALQASGALCVGSPATVRDQLVAQAEEIGCGHIINWGTYGTLTKEQTIRSYELYAKEVIPALRAM